MSALVGGFASLGLDENTSRSKAARNKKAAGDLHFCVVCFHRFHSHAEMGKLLKKVHRAVAKNVKTEFQQAKEDCADDPDDEVNNFNYKISLLKVTFLEKFRSRRTKQSAVEDMLANF